MLVPYCNAVARISYDQAVAKQLCVMADEILTLSALTRAPQTRQSESATPTVMQAYLSPPQGRVAAFEPPPALTPRSYRSLVWT